MRISSMLFAAALLAVSATTAVAGDEDLFTVRVSAPTWDDRAELAAMGFDLEGYDFERGEAFLVAGIDDVRALQDGGFAVRYEAVKAFPPSMVDYHDEAETAAFLADLATAYPDLTSLLLIGTTLEGRSIQCLKISDNADTDEDEPGFFLVGRHHAREPMSTDVPLLAAERFLENYDTDPFIQYLVDHREIYVVPRLNMDGATYDEDNDLVYWRKNRNTNDSEPPSCWGVDPNRNYGYEWGRDGGSSGNPCSEVYRGESAFSDVESRAVRDFVEAHTNIVTLISLHTFGDLVMYPWGWKSNPIADADDLAIFRASSELFAEPGGYQHVQSCQLYPTSGDTIDWAYGALGVFGYTIEMTDEPDGFYVTDDLIPETFEENWPAMRLAAAMASEPEMVRSSALWRFEATSLGDAAEIAWAPMVEYKAEGWEVWRSDTETGTYARMTIPAMDPGEDAYEFQDGPAAADAADATYTYWYKVKYLSDIDNDREFGPISVTVNAPLPDPPGMTTTTTTAGSTTTTTTQPPDDDVDDDADDDDDDWHDDDGDDDVADDDVDDDTFIPDDDADDDTTGVGAGGEENSDGGCGC